MFTDCEIWRREFGVDDLIENFSFEEKPLVSAYYPQYYHKTDKVYPFWNMLRIGWATNIH